MDGYEIERAAAAMTTETSWLDSELNPALCYVSTSKL